MNTTPSTSQNRLSMPEHIVPHLERLTRQINGIFSYYSRMLDDEFLFAAGAQVPQAATIFDATAGKAVSFSGGNLSIPYLIALIAYRYGFTGLERIGHGGYAVAFSHDSHSRQHHQQSALPDAHEVRRVLRLVPDHHVPDITGSPQQFRPFDVELDADNNPIRRSDYPLLLSDVFLLPRHTTRLVFHTDDGDIIPAGGRPAILHCQVLPQVIPLNSSDLNRQMAHEAGELLEIALATLGVRVADAHGGNGGVLVGMDGNPLLFSYRLPDGTPAQQYIPVVLDYGYYSQIEASRLADLLIYHGVTTAMMQETMDTHLHGAQHDGLRAILQDDHCPLKVRFSTIIAQSGLDRAIFGRILYRVEPPGLLPEIWIHRTQQVWETIKEQSYPPLNHQSRLETIYPAYDEMLFPQHIEEYHLPLAAVS